jgi:hypothetical protein
VAITKPTVNGSSGTWGTLLNQALDDLQSQIDATIPENTITARGDLIAGTAASTAARLPVGATGRVLTADTAAGTGMSWQLAPGALVLKVRATGSQNLADSTNVALNFNAIDYDRFGTFNAAGATSYAPGVTGWYELNGAGSFVNTNSGGSRSVVWLLNGVSVPGGGTQLQPVNTLAMGVAARPTVVQLTAITDTISLAASQTSGVQLTTASAAATLQVSMHIKYLGS